MIFSSDSIKQILAGKKTQTRRLLKEGESLVTMRKNKRVLQVISKKGAVKWEVGKHYAVQNGRGKKQLWFCDHCKKVFPLDAEYDENRPLDDFRRIKYHSKCVNKLGLKKPLFIKIMSLKSEALFCINEKQARAEGFDDEQQFLYAFYKLNWNKVPKKEKACCGNDPATCEWNPLVWVISFKLVR